MSTPTDVEMDPGKAGTLPLLARASRTFRFRCLVDAMDEIMEAGKCTRDQHDACLRSLLQEEITKGKILAVTATMAEPALLDTVLERVQKTAGINETTIVARILQLVAEGHLAMSYTGERNPVITHVTSDPDRVKTIYVPVQTIEDGKSCSGCAMCQAACPVGCIDVDDGKLSIDMDTCIRCGLCYTACPRSFLPKPVLDRQLGGKEATGDDLKIGFVMEAWSARTCDASIDAVKQDGGIVSSLLLHAFNAGHIDLALGSAKSDDMAWKPVPLLMQGKEDVIRAAGTKYVNTPTLKLLPAARKSDKIAVVGTPCMMQALKKAEVFPSGTVPLDTIKYRIGIFCMESFTHAGIKQLSEKILETPLDTVKKMDINAGQFFVYVGDTDPRSVGMKEITKLARLGCHGCYDLTSETADIAVGSIGSPAGWNTVLVRTEAGKQLFDAAVASGLIERKPIDEVQPGLLLLKKLSLVKKRTYEKEEAKRDEANTYHPAYFMKLPPPPPPKKETPKQDI